MQSNTFQKANNMTKNQKIIVGVGVVVLIYAYFKNLSITKTSVSTPLDPNNPRTSTPKLGGDVDKKYEACLKEFESLAMPQVTPRFNFKQYKEDYINNCMKKNTTPLPISDDYKFEVLENFSVEYFSSTTGRNTIANFKKGQIIHAKPIPMGNVGGLATTPDGKYPNMGIGSAIVNVPQNKLRRILDK